MKSGTKDTEDQRGVYMTDRELLRAYAESNDGDALGVFMTRYQGTLLRFVSKLLGDREAAQDVVQDTFLQVARHPRRLLDIESHHNWLLRVARNLGISHLRRKARMRRHTEAFASRAAAEAREREDEKSRALEEEETRSLVRAEINRLGPRHREVLLLKVQEEKSYREIAEITGLSATNVGYILHQAVKELSRRLNHPREEPK